MTKKQHYMNWDERQKLDAYYNDARLPVSKIAELKDDTPSDPTGKTVALKDAVDKDGEYTVKVEGADDLSKIETGKEIEVTVTAVGENTIESAKVGDTELTVAEDGKSATGKVTMDADKTLEVKMAKSEEPGEVVTGIVLKWTGTPSHLSNIAVTIDGEKATSPEEITSESVIKVTATAQTGYVLKVTAGTKDVTADVTGSGLTGLTEDTTLTIAEDKEPTSVTVTINGIDDVEGATYRISYTKPDGLVYSDAKFGEKLTTKADSTVTIKLTGVDGTKYAVNYQAADMTAPMAPTSGSNGVTISGNDWTFTNSATETTISAKDMEIIIDIVKMESGEVTFTGFKSGDWTIGNIEVDGDALNTVGTPNAFNAAGTQDVVADAKSGQLVVFKSVTGYIYAPGGEIKAVADSSNNLTIPLEPNDDNTWTIKADDFYEVFALREADGVNIASIKDGDGKDLKVLTDGDYTYYKVAAAENLVLTSTTGSGIVVTADSAALADAFDSSSDYTAKARASAATPLTIWNYTTVSSSTTAGAPLTFPTSAVAVPWYSRYL